MGQVYNLLRPYLDSADTYVDIIRLIFMDDANKLNTLYELLTRESSQDVDGISIIADIVDCLQANQFGSFVALMRERK